MDNKSNEFTNPSLLNSNVVNDDRIQQIIDELKKQTTLLDQILNKNSNIIEETVKNEIEENNLEPKESVSEEVTPVVESNEITPEESTPVVEAPLVEEVNIEKPEITEVKIEEPTSIEPTIVENETSLPEENVEQSLEETSEPVELNPVLEQTIELPQDNIEEQEVKNTEPSIIGMDELLKETSVPEIKVEETPIVSESVVEQPAEVNQEPVVAPEVQPVVETPVVEAPIVSETKIEEPVQEAPVANEPVIENPVVSEPVVEQPVEVNQESVATSEVQPVVETPVVEAPIVSETKIEEPVQEAPVANEPIAQVQEPIIESTESNIEILNSDILNDAIAHANGSQRVVEVDNNNLNNQVSNQKTLINKVA